MSNSIPNGIKFYVNNKIVDLRCLENNNPNLKLKEKDNCECNETLLKGSPQPKGFCLKLKRPNQKRSRTADPRFRRSRSPHHQQMCITQSEDTINKSLDVKTNKSSSISSPNVNKQSSIKEEISSKPVETIKNESSSFVSERELSFVEGEGSGHKPNYREILNSFDTEPSLVGSEVNFNDLNSLVTEDEEPIKHNEYFKPYWEDPRYPKNCNTVKINTLPLLSTVPDYYGRVLCRISQCNKDISSYKYDQGSEISFMTDGCMQKKNLHKDGHPPQKEKHLIVD